MTGTVVVTNASNWDEDIHILPDPGKGNSTHVLTRGESLRLSVPSEHGLKMDVTMGIQHSAGYKGEVSVTSKKVEKPSSIGEDAYARYCAVVGTCYDGRELPKWEDLAEITQQGWTAAAQIGQT